MAEIVAITGATGLIGQALCKLLVDNGQVVRALSRTKKPHPVPGVDTYVWNPAQGTLDGHALQGATVVINLAGENLGAKRWTPARKEALLKSRVVAAQTLQKGLETYGASVHTVVGMSAIGFYAPNRVQTDESGPAGEDFLAQVCQAWEDAQIKMAGNRRLVLLRAGLVLGKDGGVYKELTRPMQFGFGVWFGTGTQVMSWIHLRDMVGIIHYVAFNGHVSGIINAVANESCSQEYFIRYLSKYMHRLVLPFGVPAILAKLLLGEMAQMVLEGSAVVSNRLKQTGFKLKYPYLYDALRELTKPSRRF